MWAGDQDVDFTFADGLPSVIPAALSMGMSGVGITHFDIGGYTTFGEIKLRRSPELLLRSAEAAIFTPMFRSHEGNQPQENTQFYSSPEIESAFGRLAQIYVHISNYTKLVVKNNSEQGIPVQQPLFLAYPDDPIAWSTTYQYMFGRDVLVAPVIGTNVSTMNVYLPNDSSMWVYIWNGEEFQGPGYVTVPSEIGKPPAFFLRSSTFSSLFSSIRTKFPYVPFIPNTPTETPHTSSAPHSTETSHTTTAKSQALKSITICPHSFYIQYLALSIYNLYAFI
ncbi:hypothetical protein CHS0354_008018 [Potamilus streckersoni]|uniref:Uncharacterized protein n=1 Tax=Potamilus streckersoni TaxID=2493646 RepID=A0AAE0T2N5_9BIVA|nr:hypothetical protein CHS0354_008018 [Potamilus streckersoni]